MQVLIMTSDKYINAVKPFMYLWQKYFEADYQYECVVCGFTPPDFPLVENFKFYSVGKFEDYPINKWSDQLINVLDNVADNVFILMLEDYWLPKPANTQAIKILYDYMLQFQYVLKMDLVADRLYAHGMTDYGHVSYIDLVKSMPGSPYHMSLIGGMWNRDLMKKVLIPNETPWDIEITGTMRLSTNHSDMLVLGTRQWPLRHILAFRGGDSSKLLVDDLTKQDVDEMRKLGLFEGLE